MAKSTFTSPKITQWKGASFSAGTKSGNLLFAGAFGPFDARGELVGHGDIRAQTRQVLENLKAVVEAGGGKMSDIMKTTVFIARFDDFAAMDEVYRTFFPSEPPARTPIVAGLVKENVLVEIDAFAVIG